MIGKDILNRFDFKVDYEPNSIYPFSPVYKISDKEKEYIIKRTQKHPEPLIAFTKMLHEKGINVVTPVELHVENPQKLDDETYVVYPFIDGTTYTGKEDEIYQSGKLFGKIHALSPDQNIFELGKYDVFDFTGEEIEESVAEIAKHASLVNFKLDSNKLKEKLIQIVSQQDDLQNSGLVSIATPHDYKANNLVFTPSLYLIDPDNATWIPRIFDLALALFLFHNELESAPDRMFTPSEWKLFMSGYKEYVTLSQIEIAYWNRAIEHVFLDEVMWLMAEYKEDWENPSQQKLFRDLLEVLFDSSQYRIS
ncbi:phosphotransferase [Ornithinibacillus salinisoli]|uniref:Phosphotransferase n=1 Tax=Ornithinibacillus salinisoli TaxID=1848459 RepID=A0ABW4VTK5_9BACI